MPALSLSQLPAIAGLTSDSREVKPGFAFFAVRGTGQDGHRFIAQAERAGAICAIGEEVLPPEPIGIPYIRVEDARLALAEVAAEFFGHPSHSLKMVGVTGTSGKTTTTYLIESLLEAGGERVGVIGTINFRFGKKIYPSTHTTPGPVELQRLLAEMKREGCTAVVMEVSSHALKQHRASGIAFDAMVFTNLSPEHLDFHPDMEDYFQSKLRLFTELADYARASGKSPKGYSGIDSDHGEEYGKRLLNLARSRADSPIRMHSFGLSAEAEISGKNLKVSLAGIEGRIGLIEVRSPLTARFNAQNILGAVGVAQGFGISPARIARGIEALRGVPGRLERVPNRRGIHVLVDYAHKPDALEKVLRTLDEVKGGNRIITVFGCGGDRDRTKRPVMAAIAARFSDFVYVTSDNPRTEKPEVIIQEILEGFQIGHAKKTPYAVEPDRAKAIKSAILEAKMGDLVLIAGKGHEDYQIIADPSAPQGTRKIHFDDREVAAQALSS